MITTPFISLPASAVLPASWTQQGIVTEAAYEIIQKVGANSIKDMGKVMGELKKQYSDNLDFAKAGALLKELLNKQ